MENLKPNNSLHGVTLQNMLDLLVKKHGFEYLGEKINIKCFTTNPTIKSSLTFLRKTPWARARVESLYIETQNKI